MASENMSNVNTDSVRMSKYTYIVKNDITSIHFYWSHAPYKECTFYNQICWKRIWERVEHKVQEEFNHRKDSEHHPVLHPCDRTFWRFNKNRSKRCKCWIEYTQQCPWDEGIKIHFEDNEHRLLKRTRWNILKSIKLVKLICLLFLSYLFSIKVFKTDW